LISDFKFIDLFAGIGGFHIALSNLGGKCVFASEWDKDAQNTYFSNFGLLPHGDITKINEADIPPHDVLTAGFPCQAFSISGKQRGFNDTRGTLFFDVARIVKLHRPSVVFLENVKNFERHDFGNTLKVVKSTMTELGYNVFHKVLKSSYYGVPQARERIYIICLRDDLKLSGLFEYPAPLLDSPPPRVMDILEKSTSKEFLIERDDIEIYRDPKNIKCEYSPFQIGKLNKGGQGERIYSVHSPGITLSAYGGGAAAKTGAYLVGKKVRKLTPKECLRMQGFPSDFKLPESKNVCYRLLGNSVSVPVISAILAEILKQTNNLSLNSNVFKKNVRVKQVYRQK
jgi:DNA (cytosine-5)-methyltransferase 1